LHAILLQISGVLRRGREPGQQHRAAIERPRDALPLIRT